MEANFFNLNLHSLFDDEKDLKYKIYYFLYFAVVGINEPYLNLYWYHLGLSGSHIGVLTSIPNFIQIFCPFIWTALADARGMASRIFVFNIWVSLIAFSGFLFFYGYRDFIIIMLIYSIFKSPIIPIANAMTLEHLKGKRGEFGKIRAWGSVGYIFTAVIIGSLIDHYGSRTIPISVVFTLFLCALSSLLKFKSLKEGTEQIGKEYLVLMKNVNFLIFLVSSLVLRLSSGAYQTLFTIYLEKIGISKGSAGIAWSIGVASEIIIMMYWPALLKRFGIKKLIASGFVASAIRWYLYSIVDDPVLIFLLQLLHGLTFGAFYLGAVTFVDITVAENLRNSGQGIFAAVTYGIGGVLGNYFSGFLFDKIDTDLIFKISSLIAAIATVIFMKFVIIKDKSKD